MRLHLSYVAARERETGAVEILENSGDLNAGSDVARVAALYRRFLSPEGDDLRRKYSHVLYVLDNVERGHHEFPDPANAEREQLQAQILEARRALETATQTAQTAAETAASARLAKDERKAAQARLDALQRDLERLAPKPLAGPVIPPAQNPPKQPPRQPAVPRDVKLEDYTDEQLLTVAAEYEVTLDPSITREKLIAAIYAKAGYEQPDTSEKTAQALPTGEKPEPSGLEGSTDKTPAGTAPDAFQPGAGG